MAKRYIALSALWFILVVGPLVAACVLTARLSSSSSRHLRFILPPFLVAFAGACHLLLQAVVRCLSDRENVSTTPLVSSGKSLGYAHFLTTPEGKQAAINAGVLPEPSSSSWTPTPQVDSSYTPTPKPDFSTPATTSGAVAQIQDAPAIIYIPVPPAQNAVGQFAGYIPFNLMANHGAHVENGAVEMHQFGAGHSNDGIV